MHRRLRREYPRRDLRLNRSLEPVNVEFDVHGVLRRGGGVVSNPRRRVRDLFVKLRRPRLGLRAGDRTPAAPVALGRLRGSP
eukprot:29404-Pelagococcus_subviridis.AAC.7